MPAPGERLAVLRSSLSGWRAGALGAAWLLLASAAALGFFLTSSRSIVLASHDAVVRPTLTGQVVVRTGPILPDLRVSSGQPLGLDIRLGKTDAASIPELVRRYAYIASQPEGQVAKVHHALVDMAYAAALRGAALGSLPIVVWLLIGADRRRELVGRLPGPGGLLAGGGVLVLGLALLQPWTAREDPVAAGRSWVPLAEFVGPDVPLPPETDGIEVAGDATTAQTRRLLESALDTFRRSKVFYREAARDAAELPLRRPQDGDTVAVLVSDRHDNIGMDAVTRAIAEEAGATVVIDAGDDTSVGGSWEAFSLDSLTAAFSGFERWAVAGNHDHGPFVRDYLSAAGWQMPQGEVVGGPAGSRLLGVDDPRSSGLGNWRDETGLSFAEVGNRLADAACRAEEQGERVATILVHDADLGAEALARGCVDLVVGGHLHVQVGPTLVVGANGRRGYSYTNGTTGGAAYAIAVGSKPRRPAGVSLVTYRDGRPIGVQAVQLQTNGTFSVSAYVPLLVDLPDSVDNPAGPPTS